jgi:hypothetical protein
MLFMDGKLLGIETEDPQTVVNFDSKLISGSEVREKSSDIDVATKYVAGC